MYYKITPEIERLIREIFTDGDFIHESDALVAALRLYRREQLAGKVEDATLFEADEPASPPAKEQSLRDFYNQILQDAQSRPSGNDQRTNMSQPSPPPHDHA